ncbi:MAG: sugar transporter substrate-binding protein, partial [Acidimicrobiaceae bacterium]|nr:sugar transporter substrate-binding protein [Acidimicrobiaceae bacterium]
RAPKTHKSAAAYNIYLSNNYLGNTWRVQMEKSAEAAAALSPLKGKVVLHVVNAAQTVPAQITSLEAIIARHPSAILIDAASPTALNPEIATACAQHIVVVNFDQPVTAPCAYRVTSNTNAAAVIDAQWIVGVLHGKGNIYLDSGLPGAPLSNAGVQLDLSIFKKYPGIHVVGYYQSQYAIGPEQQGVASLLAAHPNVNGIISQAYCTGAIAALKSAGHPLVPMVCAAFNGTMVALASDKGANGFTTANPPYLSADAMRIAVQVLGGQKQALHQILPLLCYYTEGPLPKLPVGGNCQKIKLGVNAFPKASPGLSLPASPSWTTIPISAVTP